MAKFFKVTEELLDECSENNNYKVIRENLSGDMQYITNGLISKCPKHVYGCLQNCESPIEQLLAINMMHSNIRGLSVFYPGIIINDIYNQPIINCKQKSYRVDFSISVKYFNLDIDKCFVIECDGHDFHEKTKDQVKRDNDKNRDLIENGYIVIRFSGSEIYNSPLQCISKIIGIITNYPKTR